MRTNTTVLTMLLLILAAFCSCAALAAGNLTAKAETFVQTMAKGDFAAAETDFTDQMKQVSPDQLKGIWDGVVLQAGAFQKIGATKTVHEGGYDSVIVNTEFKNQTIGFLVTFDSTGKIGGLHFVAPIPAQ